MSTSEMTGIIVVDGKVYERRPDGMLAPIPDRTDEQRLDALSDADIEANAAADPDALPMTDEDWVRGVPGKPVKVPVGIKLDDDVLRWFKSLGARGYQTRINAVLRTYMEAHRKAG